jgi:uncharacterized phage protein (TIGR01671 family)
MNNSRFKFRAWDLLNHRMWPVVSPDFILKRCIIGVSPEWQENAIYEMRLEDLIIQQFTGLEDKYGNEIYEGDIVMWRGYEVENGKQIRPERILTISDYIKNTYNLMCITEGTGEVVEVIGNIYENPELMEANNE